MAVGKVQVRNYNKRDGTHVKSYTREQSSSLGASGELPPEGGYEPEATETGEKEGDQGDQDKVRARDRRENGLKNRDE